jgi:hypothetical protein
MGDVKLRKSINQMDRAARCEDIPFAGVNGLRDQEGDAHLDTSRK